MVFPLDKNKTKKILEHLSWLRVSLNAGTKKNYSVIHNTKSKDFNIVINNLREAVKIRDKNKYSCAIGVQFLLIPQNHKEAPILARMLSDMGLDYLVIKPYSQHPSSINRIGSKFKYTNLFPLGKELEKYSKNNFRVIFRRHAMERPEERKPYKYCLGLPFAIHITAEGDPCNAFVGNKEFVFGNICQESFEDIWEGERRKRITEAIYAKWDTRDCRKSCRLDEINRYLWELKNPGKHINFI